MSLNNYEKRNPKQNKPRPIQYNFKNASLKAVFIRETMFWA